MEKKSKRKKIIEEKERRNLQINNGYFGGLSVSSILVKIKLTTTCLLKERISLKRHY